MLRCDVLAVGTELLLGDIVDTNSAYIGEALAAAGVASHLHVHVGDNVARIAAALGALLDEADAVIVCGGLGPTHDDLTRDAIARLADVPLDHDESVAAALRERFARRNRAMAESNLRQAQVPRGARVIDNPVGTAPALCLALRWAGRERLIYAVPGVPAELQLLVETRIVPELRARAGEERVIQSRVLKTWGIPESSLGEQLAEVIDELDAAGNPTLALLASGWNGMKIRLTAAAGTAAEAGTLLDTWDGRVAAVVGDALYGRDAETMESVVLAACRARGWTLGTAESLTGGLLAARLTEIPGASDTFRGSVVSYAGEVKFDVLGVPRGPVVSEAAARAMASGAQRVLGADVAVALTGVAGPTEQEGQPVGTVCVAVVTPDAERVATLHLGGSRRQIRELAVISALALVRELVG